MVAAVAPGPVRTPQCRYGRERPELGQEVRRRDSNVDVLAALEQLDSDGAGALVADGVQHLQRPRLTGSAHVGGVLPQGGQNSEPLANECRERPARGLHVIITRGLVEASDPAADLEARWVVGGPHPIKTQPLPSPVRGSSA